VFPGKRTTQGEERKGEVTLGRGGITKRGGEYKVQENTAGKSLADSGQKTQGRAPKKNGAAHD